MRKHHTLNYLEFTAPDLEVIKKFYASAFGWEFTDYGDTYVAFTDGTMDGGFAKAATVQASGVLPILFSDNLESSQKIVEESDGIITKPIFSFPGGRRFHFTDPAGNELAVWAL